MLHANDKPSTGAGFAIFHKFKVDDLRSIRAKELLGVEPIFKIFDRPAH